MHEPATVYSAAALQRFGAAALEAVGSPPDLAGIVAESLVDANLAGHDSHGVMRLPSYAMFARTGRLAPAARPSVENRQGATATVDGHWGWGQPAARLAVATATALAGEQGVGAVTIRRCNHIGRLGEYVEAITRAGMMGVALCNGGSVVAPYGGRDRLLGTNPLAWAAPTADPRRPLMLDFATSAVAEGKLQVAQAKGQAIPAGWVVDAQGRPATALDAFYNGGALVPFGAHKGYGLSVMVEFLAGALSGAMPSCLPEFDGSNGTLVMAVNISAFRPLEVFVDAAERFYATFKRSRAAEGREEVLLPGEPEATARRERAVSGVPVPEQTRQELGELAEQLGLDESFQ